ncbi:MAG: hypothetical protein JJU09_06760 [Rhodobacteraceae bacterium]|nr:hypothetical protein [Paracoccaceae bacterium]
MPRHARYGSAPDHRRPDAAVRSGPCISLPHPEKPDAVATDRDQTSAD